MCVCVCVWSNARAFSSCDIQWRWWYDETYYLTLRFDTLQYDTSQSDLDFDLRSKEC